MSRTGKPHPYFSIDTRFTFSPQATGGILADSGATLGELGLAFPLYPSQDLAGASPYAPVSTWDDAFIARLRRGGDGYIGLAPSEVYAQRLLQFHFDLLTSQRARTGFLVHVQSLIRAAIKQAVYELMHPSSLDLSYDAGLKHLRKQVKVLEYALQWVQAQVVETKIGRPLLEAPTLKVKVLAYLAVIEAGDLPAMQGLPSKQLAEAIALDLRANNDSASAGSILRYINARRSNTKLFIRTPENYVQAREWIASRWPTIDVERLPPLQKL